MLEKSTLNNWHQMFFSLLTIVLLSSLPDAIHAQSKYPQLKMNGFAMQSYMKTDGNNFLGKTSASAGSFGYSEVGINGFMKISQNFQLASQVLSRRAGASGDGMPKLDFALLDYRFIDNQSIGFGFRLGRIKNPFGFYNETRDISFTRESIILPQSIYFDRTRDLSISSDGLHVYARKQTMLGSLNGLIGMGFPLGSDESSEYALLGDDRPGELITKPSLISRLKVESDGAKVTAAYSYINMNMEYKPGLLDAPVFNGNGSINFDMHILSIKYHLMRWSFSGEYARRKVQTKGIVYVPSAANGKVGESFYVQSIYRPTQKWNLIARYDVLYADKEDRDGVLFVKNLKAIGISGVQNYSRYAKDIMLGLQFNINRHWMSRFEIHSIDGVAWLPKQDNPDDSVIKRKWRMLNASISYRF